MTTPTGSPIDRFKALTPKQLLTSAILAACVAIVHGVVLSAHPLMSMPSEFILGFCFSLIVGLEMGYDIRKDVWGFLASVAVATFVGALMFSIKYLLLGE